VQENMWVIRAVVTILFFGCAAISGAAQSSDVRIDLSKPTVYIAFERLGSSDLVWLRLRNNSHWAISLRTEDRGAMVVPLRLSDGRIVSSLPDGLEVTPEYLIENIMGPNDGGYWCTSSRSWLAPGLSAIFSFHRESLKPFGRYSIRFDYEWEGTDKEPEHRVNFTDDELKLALGQISQ
jgi:hypothetical protein